MWNILPPKSSAIISEDLAPFKLQGFLLGCLKDKTSFPSPLGLAEHVTRLMSLTRRRTSPDPLSGVVEGMSKIVSQYPGPLSLKESLDPSGKLLRIADSVKDTLSEVWSSMLGKTCYVTDHFSYDSASSRCMAMGNLLH
jgi:hypothetical protein